MATRWMQLDAAGRRIRASRESGQGWDYGYDDVGQVTSGVKKFPDGSAIPGHSFAYQYDGTGNRTSATQGGTHTGVTYTPNALNQYSNITTEGGRFILGEAPVANPVIINGDTSSPAARAGGLGFYWKQITGNNSAGPLWSNDSIVSGGVTISGNTWTPPNSVTPIHDDDGNLTYDGRWDSVWDAENRLVRMQTTETAATAGVPRQRLDFVYDCQNRRVSKTVSTSTDGTTWTVSSSLRFLYDGWNMIAEYSASSDTPAVLTLQAAHVWSIDLSGTPQGAGGVGGLLCSTLVNDNTTTHNCYPAYDGNGNISAWLDSTGTLLARMDYSPFGQVVAQYKYTSTANATLSRLRFGFSTKYTDKETGLLYYGHRYYDSVTGRWPSRDPIGEGGGENLYGFVRNYSTSRIDRFGLMVADDSDGEIGQPLKKCEIEIRVNHLVRGGRGNFKDLGSRDFVNAPTCSRIGYVGCGANWLNGLIPKHHSAQIDPVEEDTEISDNDRNLASDAGIPKDALDKNLIGVTSDLINDIDSAIASAQRNVGGMCRPAGCCKTVRMKVNCLANDIAQRVSIMRSNFIVLGGKYDNFNEALAIGIAIKKSKCGKVSVYECSTKIWSTFSEPSK